MKRLFALAFAMAAYGCGQKNDDKPDSVQPGAKITSQRDTNDHDHDHDLPPPEDPDRDSVDPLVVGANPLAGLFEQVENRQSKIRVSTLLIVDTNMVIPAPQGDGTRVSPKFPHQLQFDEALQVWKTIGFYNDANQVFKNVELRLRNYDEGRLLDVTLAIPPSSTLPQDPNQPGNPYPQPGYGDGYGNGQGYDCPPYYPPGGGGGQPRPPQLLYQYRYERVVNAPAL